MPRNRKPFYDVAEIKRLEGIALPEKIKCGRCGKYVSQKKYSNKQLTDARSAIRKDGLHAKYSINCHNCVGGPIVEIKCTSCSKTKGLEEFAKSQRRNPDDATCYVCMEERKAIDPIEEDVYESQDRSGLFTPDDVSYEMQPSQWTGGSAIEASDSGTWSQDNDDGGVQLGSEFQSKLSIDPDSHLIDTEDEPESNDDGWKTVSTVSRGNSTTSSTTSGFNANKYGKPSAGASSGSLYSFDSGYAEKSGSTPIRKGGFAKIKAYDPKKDGPPIVAQPAPNKVEDDHEWSSSESDDDDDDGDSDDDTVI